MEELLRLFGTVHEVVGSYQALETPNSLIKEERIGWPDWFHQGTRRAIKRQDRDVTQTSEIHSQSPSK